MSQLRKDPISGRWVIIASERGKRPDDFRSGQDTKPEPVPSFCSFCAGNEAKTPPEVYALRDAGTLPDHEGWWVRVVPNKFPALERGGNAERFRQGLFERMAGIGVHEVVIETPDHGQELADLELPRFQDVLFAYQQRMLSIEQERQYQFVQVFKNKGREAGASLSHPHSQIVATPIIPKRIKEEIYGADRLYRQLQECIFCRTIKQELALGERVVFQDVHFCVVTPFASRFPFEMHVYPLRHASHFRFVTAEEVGSLAAALKTALTKLRAILNDPPYNFLIHQSPSPNITEGEWPGLSKNYHWHLEILPVLTRVAGFELGTGFYINPVPPEAAADFLLKA